MFKIKFEQTAPLAEETLFFKDLFFQNRDMF
jgi:hypothetical protein